VGNDKDESLKEIFNMYLKLKNFDVEEASDGEEGLKKRKLGSPISFY
jgi:DNA-binding response OmpR family regulator